MVDRLGSIAYGGICLTLFVFGMVVTLLAGGPNCRVIVAFVLVIVIRENFVGRAAKGGRVRCEEQAEGARVVTRREQGRKIGWADVGFVAETTKAFQKEAGTGARCIVPIRERRMWWQSWYGCDACVISCATKTG